MRDQQYGDEDPRDVRHTGLLGYTKVDAGSPPPHASPVVRRLPVLQNSAPEDAAAAERPKGQWIAIGAGFVFSFWLPLALVAVWLGRTLAGGILDPGDPEAVAQAGAGARAAYAAALVVPALLSFGFACWAGGAVVGRFGGSSGARESAWAATLAALLAAIVAALGGGFGSWPVAILTAMVLAGLGSLFGWLGGRWGLRRRPT